jgi:ABC-type multidrug transport system fused ATPase/permease subunit
MIMEEGTHDELIARGKMYADLCKVQAWSDHSVSQADIRFN